MTAARGWRPLVALLIGAVLAGIALVPAVNRRLSAHNSPYVPVLKHLFDQPPPGPEPQTLRPVPFAQLRAAARLMPPAATYYLNVASSDALLTYTLRGVTDLYLADDLPVTQPADAEWILSYRARAVPVGVRARRVVSLGSGVHLVHTRGP